VRGGIVFSQLIEARVRIGAIAAELAIPRLTQKHIAELAEEIVEMHAALNDPEEFAIHSMRFHRIIAKAAGNEILCAMLDSITANLFGNWSNWVISELEIKKSAEVHREIYRAIRFLDTSRAKQLIEAHPWTTFLSLGGARDREARGPVLTDETAQSSNSSQAKTCR
jgi:GntR family transcriptional repressor for pyruvate dehydrogenase complex